MREELIGVGPWELSVLRPDEPEALIDEERFARDEFMPYWAELWPSGVALARHVAALDLRGYRVVEVGCGLGLPSLTAARAGAAVLATDWAPEALALLRENAGRNGVRVVDAGETGLAPTEAGSVETAVLDWHGAEAVPEAPFDLVLAADVLYEERNAGPLLALLRTAVADHGEALVADPGRRHAPAFLDAARRDGWIVRQGITGDLPHGWIAQLRR